MEGKSSADPQIYRIARLLEMVQPEVSIGTLFWTFILEHFGLKPLIRAEARHDPDFCTSINYII